MYHREMILTYGLWDQIHVDHGKEFYLMLYVQESTILNKHKQGSSYAVNITTGKTKFSIYTMNIICMIITLTFF